MSQPFYFGEGRRRLFGIYTPPSGTPAGRGIVLCPPWGNEYIRAHRSFRVLADILAARGLHVLRFDYFGTGDSAGGSSDFDWKGSLDDVAVAVEELRSISGVAAVGLLGLRLGASVAAAASVSLPRVRRLAFWDPVVDGRSYLEELRLQAGTPPAPAAAPAPPEGGEDALLEVSGFPLTPTLAADMARVRLSDFEARPGTRLLLVVTEETEAAAALRETLAGRVHDRFHYRFAPGPRAWQQELDFGAGAVPTAAIECLSSWEW